MIIVLFSKTNYGVYCNILLVAELESRINIRNNSIIQVGFVFEPIDFV